MFKRLLSYDVDFEAVHQPHESPKNQNKNNNQNRYEEEMNSLDESCIPCDNKLNGSGEARQGLFGDTRKSIREINIEDLQLRAVLKALDDRFN